MKKKFVTCLLIGSFLLAGCGSATSQDVSASKEQTDKTVETSSVSETSADLEAVGDVNVDKGALSVTITLPAEFIGDTTQEELDTAAKEIGYKVTLNDDGSATYVMTKKQHKQLMQEYKNNLNEFMSEMIGSEDYPNITNVTANDDFSSYTITTTNTEPDLNESFSVISLYTMSGIYHIFNGTTIDNVHVDFVNADSGQVISSADSSDMENTSE